jgi:multiple sugar transport system permease protein
MQLNVRHVRAAYGRVRTPFLFLLPLLLILLVINVYPTVFEIGTSFSSRTMGMTSSHFVGLKNFRHMLTDGRFWNSLWVTLRLLLFALPAELVVGTAVALLLHNSPHRKLFLPALLLPIVATPIVVGFIFKYMYQEDYGLISYAMKLLHVFPGFNLTSRIHTVLPALAFVDFWEWTPFVMLIMLAGFNGIPLSVTEAANLDGASGWKRLWFIELPMLRAEFLVALLFRTVDIIRVYDIIYATTRGGPGAFSESASVYLQITAFKFRDLGYASAFGFTLVLLGVALATLYLRLARARGQEAAR